MSSCVCLCCCRFSVGFSADGMMSGPVNAKANVMICDFSNAINPIGEYNMLGYTGSSIVAHNTAGVSNGTAYQSGGTSVMTWSRMANNGDANDAQISLSGVTMIVWATGLGNKYASAPLPPMAATAVDLSGVASVSPTTSASPSPASLSATVSVSPSAASASPAPSVASFDHSAELTPGLMLYWNRVGDRFDFKAVLSSLAW